MSCHPSYSKPILTSTRYSTISPSSTIAHDFTTSTVWMLRTVFDAVATAWRAASLHDRGLVPTISRMMMTPIDPSSHRSGSHDDTRPTRFRAGLVAAQEIRRWAADVRCGLDGRTRGGRQGPGPDLVEARTAIHGSVVPRRERYDG